MGFVHLHAHSPFSFLDGGSKIKELVARAAELEMAALAITDHDNMSGAVRFNTTARAYGIKPIHGAEVTMATGGHLVLLCKGPEGYASLSRLITKAHLSTERLHPQVSMESLKQNHNGLMALSGCRKGEIPASIFRRDYDKARKIAEDYKDAFGKDNLFIELSESLLPGSKMLNDRLTQLAGTLGLKTVATNNVHYARKEDFEIHDILTCIRTLTRIDDAHPERRLNAENYLKSEEEMRDSFYGYRRAVANASALAQDCSPAIPLDQKIFPEFVPPRGLDSANYLRRLVFQGAAGRYQRITPAITARLEHELDIILKLGYEDYFLLVWDLVQFARRSRIRLAGRGSAADSAVAYCLGITEVDAITRGLLFERFLSLERAQKPDIDVDFDSRYRDDVTRYVYDKYGAERVATVATYNTFRGRSSIRDVGKAMGFQMEEIDFMAKRVPYLAYSGVGPALERFPELRQSGIPHAKFQRLVKVCDSISGFPRHLGTHLGGVVISRGPLASIVPLQMAAKGVVVCQFDKDDVEDIGLVKLDLLSLRTLGAVDDAVDSIHKSDPDFDYDKIPLNDKATYEMLNTGKTVGVFELESPAQRALQARLGADNFEDIVASVALIRPGPIKGNMVEPFIVRRQNKEPVSYMHPRLAPILKKTFGVILFQEQVIEIATSIAGFTPGEADRLRRVMTHSRINDEMLALGRLFVEKSQLNGLSGEEAETIFNCMKGYASYGFCEAHAAAFANTAIKTAYLIRKYPTEFFAAVLSNQPMGYYPANTICVEARRRGVEILRPCINESDEHFKTCRNSIRISLRQVKDMQQGVLQKILDERQRGPYKSITDFAMRVHPPKQVLQSLVLAGAFDSFSANRRQMLWWIDTGLSEEILEATGVQGLFDAAAMPASPGSEVVDFSIPERLAYEYKALGINVSCHPMAYIRERLNRMGIVPSSVLETKAKGESVTVAGYPVRPHRPPTKSGRIIVFLSLEDEGGLCDVTVFENIYQRYGQIIFQDPCPPLMIKGKIDVRGNNPTVVANEIKELEITERAGDKCSQV